MQQATYEELQQELGLLFDYNPPPLVPDPKSRTLSPDLVPPPFYEKHLDDRLVLKRVVLMPSMTTRLSETVDKTLHNIEQQEIRLPSYGPRDYFPTQRARASLRFKDPIIDANSVAQAYRCSTAVHCMTVASMLFLSPRASQWDRALNWIQGHAMDLEDRRALEEDYALKLLYIPGTSLISPLIIPDVIWDSMDNETRNRLSQVAQRSLVIAVWQITAVSNADHYMDDMNRIASLQHFRYDKCQTIWNQTASTGELPYAPDAKSTSWGVPVAALAEVIGTATSSAPPLSHEVSVASYQSHTPRRNDPAPSDRKDKQGVKTMTGHSTSDEAWPCATMVGRSSSPATCLTTSLLQRGWFRSVLKDSTFIIFHCGNFERIGFRHRATQTLFLSELIDIPNCKDPGYGKLHIGLYISILHDVLERVSQQCSYEEQKRGHSKRRRQTQASSGTQVKRPKTRAYAAKELKDSIDFRKTYEVVRRESLIRDVVLLQLRYGHFNSPAPASFLRAGKSHSTVSQTYTPDQYMSLVVDSEIAAGATGVVHNASLEILTSDGVQRLKVVVKFALRPQQQARLRHEFSVYEHLASSEVKGIPKVFGLFKDSESETLALVMTHVGTCLLDRESDALKIIVRDPERTAFVHVLEAIHRAGVRHHDPRVENLMVQDDGSVAIIDFDKAELNASESSKAREMAYLNHILDGSYPSRDGWPSEQTSHTSNSESSADKRHWSDSGSDTE